MSRFCGNCCSETPTLAPCPCGLGERCSVPGGVCDRCYQIILTNCVDRRKELATTMTAYKGSTPGIVARNP